MRFDQTDIVISQRSTADLLDMTLLVMRKYNFRLAGAYLIGCLPFVLLNSWLVGWMVTSEGLLTAELVDTSIVQMRWRHAIDQILLVFLELPLAGMFATAFLGQVTFRQTLTWKQLIRFVSQQWFTAVVVLGVIRCGIVGPCLLLFLQRGDSYQPQIEMVLFTFCAGGLALALRTFRPFLPEIIVLERCSLVQRDAKQIRLGKRAHWLQMSLSAECASRMVIMILLNAIGLTSLVLTWLFLQGVFFGRWQWNPLLDWLVVPGALWIVGGFSTVFRFLCYLDSRIIMEGWEVELLLRTEAGRFQPAEPKGAS
jgi:hypothetical protein